MFFRHPAGSRIPTIYGLRTGSQRALGDRRRAAVQGPLHFAIPGPVGCTRGRGGRSRRAAQWDGMSRAVRTPACSSRRMPCGGRCPGGGRCPARPPRNARQATRGRRAGGRGHQRRYSWLPSAGVRACTVLPPSRVGRRRGRPSSFFTGSVRDPKITLLPLRLADDAGLPGYYLYLGGTMQTYAAAGGTPECARRAGRGKVACGQQMPGARRAAGYPPGLVSHPGVFRWTALRGGGMTIVAHRGMRGLEPRGGGRLAPASLHEGEGKRPKGPTLASARPRNRPLPQH